MMSRPCKIIVKIFFRRSWKMLSNIKEHRCRYYKLIHTGLGTDGATCEPHWRWSEELS
jgi:hypothetical protein